MIAWLSLALAGPVVLTAPPDPFERCVAEADAVAAAGPVAPIADGPIPRLAIVVGVPCHRSQAIPSLAYSSRDAARMGTALESAGFSVVRLTSSVDRADLEDALATWTTRVPEDGVVLVYFSGHGVLYEERGRVRRHLVLSDTDLARVGATALGARELEATLAALPVADRVLIQDTCYAARASDGGKSIVQPRPGVKQLALPDPAPAVTPGEQRLYASQFYEQAIELPELQGSVYTHHWLAALADPTADLDGDGCIGTLEAHLSAAGTTEAERGGFQHPQLQVGEPRNVSLSCAGTATRAVILGTDTPYAVAPGRHDVGAGTVRVEAGQWLDVAALERSRRGWVQVGLTGGLGDLGAGAIGSMGGAGWWVGADRGMGRVAVGGAVLALPGLTSAQPDPQFAGGQTLARVGWWLGSGPLWVGPVVEAGAAWRTPYDLSGRGQTSTAALAGLQAHTQVHAGPLALGLDLGLRGFPVDRDGGVRLRTRPAAALELSLRR